MINRYILFKPVLAMLFVLLLTTANQAQAQPFHSGKPEILVDGERTLFKGPVWSPDGRQIAFTSAEYRGIWVVPVDGGTPRQVTDEAAAGFGFSWSSGGSAIAARPARFDERHRYNAIKIYETETGSVRTLIDFRRGQMSLPRWTDLDQRLAVQVQREVAFVETGLEPARREKKWHDSTILVPWNNRVEKIRHEKEATERVGDFGDRNILNLVSSPDGSAIAIQILGEGIYIIDADGNKRNDFARAENPVWSPEGRYLIAMITEDDGHQITGSELYAIDTETGQRFHLTGHTDVIAMHPTISPDGRQLAFGDPDTGHIYTMTIR